MSKHIKGGGGKKERMNERRPWKDELEWKLKKKKKKSQDGKVVNV